MPWLGGLTEWAGHATGTIIVVGVAILIALAAHFVVFLVLGKVTRLSQMHGDELVVERLRQPLRWSFVAIAISVASEVQPGIAHTWDGVARFAVPALLGWVAFSLIKAFALAMDSRAELSADEQTARSRRTRIAILSRAAGFVIVFVTVALMLLGIPGVRNVGVTLMASAGLAGLAVGAAAQPALKSLIAGIQMALTEPVRIGDLVVIENETGRIEDIRLTYVVIRTADDRRLIVPTAKFLETSFQNWTRVSGGLSGSVVLHVEAGHPIGPIREAFERILAGCTDWDRRAGALQVSDVKVDGVEIKLVMSAKDPASLTRLRLFMREAMLEWLREEMPDALKK